MMPLLLAALVLSQDVDVKAALELSIAAQRPPQFSVAPAFTVQPAAEPSKPNEPPPPITSEWLEMESGEWGLFRGDELIGLYDPSTETYRRRLGQGSPGRTWYSKPEVPPIPLPGKVRREVARRQNPFPPLGRPLSDFVRAAVAEGEAMAASSWPEGMRPYTSTGYTQRSAITDGKRRNLVWSTKVDDDNRELSETRNPNRFEPWAVPGGMHGLDNWNSRPAIKVPKGAEIEVWEEVVRAGGARVPKKRWAFPNGTVLGDRLYGTDGKPFEVRLLEKNDRGIWHGRISWIGGNAPDGYGGPLRRCAECHAGAGASLQYGISLRGDDNIFSFSPFKEGTFELRTDLPVKWRQP